MERTNKKYLGFAVLAVVAIAVALMFSYFANAIPAETQAAEAENVVAAESNDTLTINAIPQEDAFGNDAPVVYYHNDKTTPLTDKLVLNDIDNDDVYCMIYNSSLSTLGVTPSATLYVWHSADQVTEFIADVNAGNKSTKYKHKITFERTEPSYIDITSKVFMYWVDAEKELQSIRVKSVQSDLSDLADKTKLVQGNLPSAISFFFENNCNDTFFDVDGAQLFGQELPFAYWVEDFGGYVRPVRTDNDPVQVHYGARAEVNEADCEVYITDYEVTTDYETEMPVIKPHKRTFRLEYLTGGAETNVFIAFNMNTRTVLGNDFEVTRREEQISFFASVDLNDYSIDGVQYKIMTLDKLKGIVDEYAQKFGKDNPIVVAIQYALNSLPSTFAAVSGLDDDCPSDIVIPDVITSKYEGYKFPVCAVLTGALSSNTVKSVTFPYTMKALFADSCSGLKNLESVTFEDSGVAFLPDMKKMMNFRVTVTGVVVKTGAEETRVMTLGEALGNIIAQNLPNPPELDFKVTSGPLPLLMTYLEGELQNESAFNATLLASVKDPMGNSIEPYMCNDNPLYHAIDTEGELHAKPIKNIRGTFKLCPFAEKVGERKIMFGTGTFSSLILDSVTKEPVVNAKVIFTDEFGVVHVTYTDSVGAFTIDDLYQTAAFLKYSGFPFHYRKFRVEANDYKTIEFDESQVGLLDGESNDSYMPRWGAMVGCYSYYNPVLTSNVVYEQGFPMLRTSVSCYIESAANLNYVADVAAGSTLSGANVQVYELNQSGAQKFVFEPEINEEGHLVSLSIRNAQSGKYLDVCGGVAANYVNVQQYDGNGTDAQKWIPEIDGEFVILHSAVNYDYVLDLNSGDATNGQNLQLFQANGSAAQKFHLLNVVPSVPAGDFDLVDGNYVIRTGVNPENVLDVQWGSTDDGADVWAYQYAKGNTNQMWEVTQVAWGYYTLKNVNTGKYLDVAGCGMVPGTNVWQYSGNDTTAQLWSISKVTENGATLYKLVNVGTGLVLDIAGASTASGANVQGYIDNGTAAQQFVFEPMVK